MLKKELYNFDGLRIFGNNQERRIFYFYELSPKWQAIAKKDFNWIDSSETQTWDEAQFFIYKNRLYCTDDFIMVSGNSPFGDKFDGYHADSYFSGILIKYMQEDTDYIKVYTYIS